MMVRVKSSLKLCFSHACVSILCNILCSRCFVCLAKKLLVFIFLLSAYFALCVCVCACPLNVHAYRPNTGQTHIVMATHTDVNKRGSRVNIVPPLVQQGAIYLNVAMKGSYLHETRAVSGK